MNSNDLAFLYQVDSFRERVEFYRMKAQADIERYKQNIIEYQRQIAKSIALREISK